MKPGVIGQGVI